MNSDEEKVRSAIAEQAGEWFVAHCDGPPEAADAAALAGWFMTSPVHVEEFLGVSTVARELKLVRSDPQFSMEAILARARAAQAEPVHRLWPKHAAQRFDSRPGSALAPRMREPSGSGILWNQNRPFGESTRDEYSLPRNWSAWVCRCATSILAAAAVMRVNARPRRVVMAAVLCRENGLEEE